MFKFISDFFNWLYEKVLNAFEKVQNFFGYDSQRQKNARKNIRREIEELERREAQEWQQQRVQNAQRVRLAEGLIRYLAPGLEFNSLGRPVAVFLRDRSRELKGEVLQRFQAEVLELCKKTLDSRIKSDAENKGSESFREHLQKLKKKLENHPITNLLTPSKDIKDALDEEEKGKIVKYLEEQCEKVIKRSDPYLDDLEKIGLLVIPRSLAERKNSDFLKIADNASYKNLGDEFLKKYLEAQVYNVILGHHDANANNTYHYAQEGTTCIIPPLLYYGNMVSAFNEYSQESSTHDEIKNIKSALGDEEFKKCVEEIMEDFESIRPGFDEKMSELCTKLQITEVDALKNKIDGNIKSIKEIAGISEQKQWANFAQQNNSRISTQQSMGA